MGAKTLGSILKGVYIVSITYFYTILTFIIIYIHIHIYIYLNVLLRSIYLSICLSIYLHMLLYVDLSKSSYTYTYMYLSFCVYICFSICLSIYLHACLWVPFPFMLTLVFPKTCRLVFIWSPHHGGGSSVGRRAPRGFPAAAALLLCPPLGDPQPGGHGQHRSTVATFPKALRTDILGILGPKTISRNFEP